MNTFQFQQRLRQALNTSKPAKGIAGREPVEAAAKKQFYAAEKYSSVYQVTGNSLNDVEKEDLDAGTRANTLKPETVVENHQSAA
ncbi:unnamed protein product [Sphenostylis stenocarpa]|uniref:Uncharacterized protein n=1 Tax=Sphenostylis stenocarpa TaxID=92480 RepID=A0AA86SSV3_9FABA|nr:unnamed protein product [Sphenostylis stenocarpa]